MSVSNQWEVVINSKKQRVQEKKLSSEQKKIVETAPKLEEILPRQQYLNSLNKTASTEKNTVSLNGKKSKASLLNTNSKQSTPKKTKNNNNNNNNNEITIKKSSNTLISKPKNMESALATIGVDQLNEHWEILKTTYPGSELLWLKGLLSYLNSYLPFDSDPLFAGKSYQYPSIIIPKTIKAAIVNFLKSVKEVNIAYFFDQLLSSLAVEMSKNQPIIGYKILLQLLAQNWPEICANNLAKTAILRNSYQNRSNIGLSILWSLGQGGYRDLCVGIKVWQNIMLQVIEIKAYSKYVCEYINKMLKISEVGQKLNMNQTEFFATYNALKTIYSIPRDCQQLITESADLFLKKYIESSIKHTNLFTILFRNLNDQDKSNSEINALINCLIKDGDCFKVWKLNYKKNVIQTYLLFKNILHQTDETFEKLSNSRSFTDFLTTASQLNFELGSTKKQSPYLKDLFTVFWNVQEKSSQQKKKSSEKKSCSSCKWVLGSLLLIGAIWGLIAYDTHLHGGVFEKSATGKALKQTGALPYVEIAWYKTMSTVARGYKVAAKHTPVYYEKVCVVTKPFIELSCDLTKIARNGLCNFWSSIKDLASAKGPIVSNFVEQYVPGLPKKVESLSLSGWNFLNNVFENVLQFCKTKVFVGSLSPENLSKALNNTQNSAVKYFNLFNQKVDQYAKLK